MSVEKEKVLKMIVRQLHYYGLTDVASALTGAASELAGLADSLGPSNELAKIISSRDHQNEGGNMGAVSMDVEDAVISTVMHGGSGVPCLEISEDDDSSKIAPAQKLAYETAFVATHKTKCTCAAFNPDGRYAATGSTDNSLKVLDVDRLKLSNGDEKPVIRTYYDHIAPVNDVAFHPNSRVLASCSDDCTIKLYDLQRVGMKRGFRYLQDAVPVKTIAFHPSGDYILAGTTDNVIRCYDVQYLKCYSSLAAQNMHQMGVNMVRYHESGKYYVSAGEDGDVKVWDTITGQCVKTLASVHNNMPVVTASVSRNGKYILTSGEDGVPKLWDFGSGKLLMKYAGASSKSSPCRASFSWNEEYVISGDERTRTVVLWCARTGTLLEKLTGHTGAVVSTASSPVEDTFISCSEDARARFWIDQDILSNNNSR